MAFTNSILIIDSDTESLKFLTDLFIREGFDRSIGVATGKDIIKVMEEKSPDIVLLNVPIKGEDPITILSKIRAIDRLLPVIMLASEENIDIAKSSIEKGASSYLIKTSAVTELMKHVRKEIDSHRNKKSRSGIDIMIIDDDQAISEMVESYLNGNGYKCISINNPKTAIAELSSYIPKLILLDIVMPGIDGIKMLEKIKSLNKNIKVIMLSGVSDKDICISAVKRGASGYITKPFSLQQLVATITTTMIGP